MTTRDAYIRDSMNTSTAINKTTDNRVIGRWKLPFSLFHTSLQLCPSVHLRVHCKADQTFFTEEDNLYIDYREQRCFCVKTLVNKYFTRNQTVGTSDQLKLRNIMSDTYVMAASCSRPTLHYIAPDDNRSQFCSYLNVMSSCLSPILTFFSSWMCRPRVPLLCNMLDRMLPKFCSFGAFHHYPYAQFMMACFQYTYRRDTVCTHICSHSSPSDSYSFNSSSMCSEHKLFISCNSFVQPYHCEAETDSVHSSTPIQFDGSTLYGDDFCDLASDSDMMQTRNTSGNIPSNNNQDTWLSECFSTVPNDFITANFSDDDNDDDSNEKCNGGSYVPVHASSLKKVSFRANCVSVAPFLTTSGTDEAGSTDQSQFKSSFFIRASDLDTSDDDDDDDDIVSDDESDCWDEDYDSCWTSPVDSAHCFLVDLDPFMVNGLYIPQTSNVPISHSRCLSLPPDSATEVESQSEKALKCINDTWQQQHNCDVTIKTLSAHQHQTKHVGIHVI